MIIVFIACLPVGHYLAWRYNWLDRLERIFFANVRDHRWLPVARLLPKRSEAESAGGVTRVGIRWIALLGLFFGN